ncbi:hypothetical protein ERJ75_000684500 [Trypanosoma vivax]|nr:hypothetical protein ERJ75_000684500 [Trypanosoma vivax]
MPQRRTDPQTTSTPTWGATFHRRKCNNESAHHPAWYRTCAGGHTTIKAPLSPTRFNSRAALHWKRASTPQRREGCPLVCTGHTSVGIAGVIEAANNGGERRARSTGRPHRNDTKQHQHHSGTNADAATTMEWKNDALAALGTIATRYAKVRQKAIDATKACEATKRCKEAQHRTGTTWCKKSRHGPSRHRNTQKNGREPRKEKMKHRRARTAARCSTHSAEGASYQRNPQRKNQSSTERRKREASAERMGTAWPRVAATMALAMTTKQAD